MYRAALGTIVLVLIAACCPTVCYAARTWTSADGKFTVEADFIEVNGPDVKIRTVTGKEITIAMSKLSQKDRDYVLAEKKKTAAKPVESKTTTDGSKPTTSDKAVGENAGQLAPITIKPTNIAYTLDAPAGAVLNDDLPQQRIVAGERFAMAVIDYGSLDSFRKNYGPDNPTGYTITRKLVDDATTAVYEVKQENSGITGTLVFATEVTVGGKKILCHNSEVDQKKWNADDVAFMIKCAKTLRLAKPDDQRGSAKPLMVGGKEPKLVPVEFTTRNVTYTFLMPVGATTDNFGDGPEGYSRVQFNEQEVLEMRPGSKEDLTGFKGYFGPKNEKGYVVKKTLVDDETTVEYIVHNPARGVDEVVFIVVVPTGDKFVVCHNSMVLENNLTEADAALLIKCAKTLKAK